MAAKPAVIASGHRNCWAECRMAGLDLCNLTIEVTLKEALTKRFYCYKTVSKIKQN
jgi:hypothetical protein